MRVLKKMSERLSQRWLKRWQKIWQITLKKWELKSSTCTRISRHWSGLRLSATCAWVSLMSWSGSICCARELMYQRSVWLLSLMQTKKVSYEMSVVWSKPLVGLPATVRVMSSCMRIRWLTPCRRLWTRPLAVVKFRWLIMKNMVLYRKQSRKKFVTWSV